jgi:hypothetical protein
MDYDEELKSAIAYWRSEMPEELENLGSQARSDLAFFPCTEDDYPGFVTACKKLSEWAERIEDVKFYGYHLDDEGEEVEVEVEVGEVSRTEIIKGLFGSLAEYL